MVIIYVKDFIRVFLVEYVWYKCYYKITDVVIIYVKDFIRVFLVEYVWYKCYYKITIMP